MSVSDVAELSPQAQALYDAISQMEIIDCHEHLYPEAGRVAASVDVFTLLGPYTHGDLILAGMTEEQYGTITNRDIPLDARWNLFEPFWERIRWGSYARAVLIAAKKFYDADDISRDTYAQISERMQAANKAGLYERVLGEACNIRYCLTQCGSTDLGAHPRLIPVMFIPFAIGWNTLKTWEEVTRNTIEAFRAANPVRTLDDLLDNMRAYVQQVKQEGAPGVKMMSRAYQAPSRAEAMAAFNRLRDGAQQSESSADPYAPAPPLVPLRDYVVDETIRYAGEQDMVVCVHTGYWGDFRTLDPLHMIPILMRHPEVRFDIYHLGYPWGRPALMLGKGFPNVWLNLCWTHIISPRFAMGCLSEAIDLLPTNKLLAFGGDYVLGVEKVYGHLVMARENVARVLAERIEEGQMTEAQALTIARHWFFDNAVDLYRLDV